MGKLYTARLRVGYTLTHYVSNLKDKIKKNKTGLVILIKLFR